MLQLLLLFLTVSSCFGFHNLKPRYFQLSRLFCVTGPDSKKGTRSDDDIKSILHIKSILDTISSKLESISQRQESMSQKQDLFIDETSKNFDKVDNQIKSLINYNSNRDK